MNSISQISKPLCLICMCKENMTHGWKINVHMGPHTCVLLEQGTDGTPCWQTHAIASFLTSKTGTVVHCPSTHWCLIGIFKSLGVGFYTNIKERRKKNWDFTKFGGGRLDKYGCLDVELRLVPNLLLISEYGFVCLCLLVLLASETAGTTGLRHLVLLASNIWF